MTLVRLLVPLLAACAFPSRSERYACKTTADCESGRTCDEYGYCVLASVDAGADGSSTAGDAGDANNGAPDGALPPDGDVLAMMCPGAGYTYVAAPSGYYRVVASGTSWTNAQAACASHLPGSTHLIVLSTPAEVTYMAGQLGWVGLSDRAVENQFATVTGETGDQRPWDSGQPDNGSGSEDCVHMISGGTLNDDQCGNDKRYVCECDGRMSTP